MNDEQIRAELDRAEMTIQALNAQIETLSRIVYDCVRLTDIMLMGHDEALYNAIVAKYQAAQDGGGDSEA